MIKLASLVLVLAACGGGNAKTTSNTGPTGETPPASTAAEEWTLVSITNADTSCNIELQGADGQTKMFDGDYELCPSGSMDANALIGQKVTITTEKGNVMAPECQGNPDCGQSVEVDVVNSIVAVPAAAP